MNGYERMHPLPLEVRADMLETVAGYTEADVDKEFVFALAMVDKNDPATLRWLATLCARCVDDLAATEEPR